MPSCARQGAGAETRTAAPADPGAQIVLRVKFVFLEGFASVHNLTTKQAETPHTTAELWQFAAVSSNFCSRIGSLDLVWNKEEKGLD